MYILLTIGICLVDIGMYLTYEQRRYNVNENFNKPIRLIDGVLKVNMSVRKENIMIRQYTSRPVHLRDEL